MPEPDLLAGAGATARYGAHVLAFTLLYAAIATGWSWLRSTGLFSLGHAAFFGVGSLTQAWLVTTLGVSPWLALAGSAAAGVLAALPLIPALRLGPVDFGLATLAYAVLLKGLVANVTGFGMEGFLLPARPAFDGATPAVLGILGALTAASTVGYQVFLGRPSGRAAAAIRQAPEPTVSLGIDLIGSRWRPLAFSAAVAAMGGALYAHLVGTVETSVVFSPTFSLLPLVLGMLGGALHPLGGVFGALVLYPLNELIFRPLLSHAHTFAYGIVLVGLLLSRPQGLLRARVPRGFGEPRTPALRFFRRLSALSVPRARRAPREPFALAVAALSVRRNGMTVLQDVGFTVEPGRMLQVLGPNGAGKTSLLLAVAGNLPAARGRISFGGVRAPGGAAARARRGVARTFQAPQPFPEWTVAENVAIAAERAGDIGDVERLVAELDLAPLRDRPAGELSVGEGKRLELARALALKPAVLLLDEPLAGLSPAAAKRVSGAIERARREGAAVVWVEHGPAPGEPANELLVLEGGRIRFLGPPGEWEAARPRTTA